MNKFLKFSLLLLIASCVSTSAFGGDKIIVNAKVWTGNVEQPWLETIVIKDNRIAAVGDRSLAESSTIAERIDAKGKLVLPGFIDNHTHFMDGAASLVSVDTQSAKTTIEFINAIADYAQNQPDTIQSDGHWIIGGIWDHEAWGGELPNREWIDPFTRSRPVFLLRTDGHMALANTAVLDIAGITNDTPDPAGGVIVRDKDGVATGILKDNAMNLVWDKIPPMSDAETDRVFDAGIEEAVKNGVTQIHNMSTWNNIEIFERAKNQGRLKIRTYYFPHISNRHKLAKRIEQQGKGDRWLRFGGVKELVDGSLGSTTAWFYEPYTDSPETSGFALMEMQDLKKSLQEAHNYGLQLAIHGIGDRANDELLALFADLNLKGHRARIEHAQHLSPAALAKFNELGVVASMQPYHAIDDGRWAEKRIGAKRLEGTYAFRSLLDANATLTFGSDWSVAPLNPLSGIYAAVTRRTIDGKNPDGWVPDQKISVEEAVRAYTVNNAWAGFDDNEVGTIEVGKLADLVILEDDIFTINPVDIINTKVFMTIIDGEVVYRLAN